MEKIGRVTRKIHICNTGGSVCLDRQLGKPQTLQHIYSMKELLSKCFNGRRKNNSCLCRENYQILMSNHGEKDKEGNAFLYSSKRENKTFWLIQKQKKCIQQRIVFLILFQSQIKEEKLKAQFSVKFFALFSYLSGNFQSEEKHFLQSRDHEQEGWIFLWWKFGTGITLLNLAVISDAYPCNWDQNPIHKCEDKINNILVLEKLIMFLNHLLFLAKVVSKNCAR